MTKRSIKIRGMDQVVWKDFCEYIDSIEDKTWGSRAKYVGIALKEKMAREGYKDYKYDPEIRETQARFVPEKKIIEKKLKGPTTTEISNHLTALCIQQGTPLIDKKNIIKFLIRKYGLEKEHQQKNMFKNLEALDTIKVHQDDVYIVLTAARELERIDYEKTEEVK